MPLALTNVCFEGKNGHEADVTRFPLMTQSGHAQTGRSSRFSTPGERLDVQPMLGDKLRCLIGDEIKVVADERAA